MSMRKFIYKKLQTKQKITNQWSAVKPNGMPKNIIAINL